MPDPLPPSHTARPSKTWIPAVPDAHNIRSHDERLEDLELVVYGNERQRVKGLIDSLSDLRVTVTNQLTVISEDVKALKDNRAWRLQMLVQLAILAGTLLTLYLAVRKP